MSPDVFRTKIEVEDAIFLLKTSKTVIKTYLWLLVRRFRVYLELSGELTFHNKEFFTLPKNSLILTPEVESRVPS